MRSEQFRKTFDKLAAAEARFLTCEFLAPVVSGGQVRVRICGIVCALRVTPARFQGWGLFRPTSHTAAELVGEAGLAERRRYLELFPSVGLILCRRERDCWLAAAAHRGDRRFRIEGLVPVRLAEEGSQFEHVLCRLDSANFWFDCRDPASDPSTAAYLRKSLQELVDPNQLVRPGLTPEERWAYAVNYFSSEEGRKKAEAEQASGRLRQALGHAGAELIAVLERKDSYRVTYAIAGREHVCAVDNGNLGVQVAGICLDGQDRRFDLTSLVGVIREAEETGEIVPVGDENHGMDESQYWNVHPPQE